MNLLLLAAAGRVSDTSVLTGINLTLIAVAMIVVVLGMLWGFRQKRLRARSAREAEARQEEVAQVAAEPSPAATPVAAPAVAEPVAPPVSAPEAPPVAPAPPPLVEAPVGDAQDVPLTRLKGLGPKAAALLGERGIGNVAALAALSTAEAQALDGELGAFAGRMAKDRWHEQAQLLAAGDVAAYEATFGKLGG